MVSVSRVVIHRSAVLALLLAIPLLTGIDGCQKLESVIARDDDPGIYKGEPDPLTETSAEERSRVLNDRLRLIQAR